MLRPGGIERHHATCDTDDTSRSSLELNTMRTENAMAAQRWRSCSAD
jgi:hypothetical protein